ncbi:histidine kinase N-terminal 7TM domain-containing diguanylate cyclase [Planobispora takensis]|uniref:histidine kinase N-terminal 7TM domain-containing diguanylate cyclase n=1 Tax=Planobispora takensis TaxID=1367882 RepID=UPI0019405AF7|nr:diguanylate cyclase [Planobispora takensis]
MPVLIAMFTLAAVVAAGVAAIGWTRWRRAPLFGVLSVFSTGVALWAVSDVIAFLVVDPGEALLWGSILFPAESVVTAGFFCLAATVADRAWRVSWRTVTPLLIEPAILIALIATNPWHRLLIPGVTRAAWQGEFILQIGPLYWPHVVYGYVLVLVALFRVARARRRVPREQRWIYNWTLCTALPPMLINLVGLPLEGRYSDMTSVGFAITVIIAYRMVAHPTLPEQIPVGRQQVFDTLSDAVIVTDRCGRILDHNPAARRLAERIRPAAARGSAPPSAGSSDPPAVPSAEPPVPPAALSTGSPVPPDASLTGSPAREIFGADLHLREETETDQALTDVAGSGVDLHLRISPLHDRRGNAIGWALAARDVTEANRLRREVEEANALLREQVVRDPLTGLYNRRHLMDTLPGQLAEAAAGGTPLTLAVVDVDHFKRVNDTYGHAAGDAVLIGVARLLASGVRHDDIVARLGGEEFVIVLPGASGEVARARLEEIRELVARSRTRAGEHRLPVTVSIGLASFPGFRSVDGLLDAADGALYAAKERGRNRVEQAALPPRDVIAVPHPAGGPDRVGARGADGR